MPRQSKGHPDRDVILAECPVGSIWAMTTLGMMRVYVDGHIPVTYRVIRTYEHWFGVQRPGWNLMVKAEDDEGEAVTYSLLAWRQDMSLMPGVTE